MNFKSGAEYLPQNVEIMNQWCNISAATTVASGILFILVMACYPLGKKQYRAMMRELKEKANGALER